jgi:hypothetical protein
MYIHALIQQTHMVPHPDQHGQWTGKYDQCDVHYHDVNPKSEKQLQQPQKGGTPFPERALLAAASYQLLAWFTLKPWRWRQHVLPKSWWTPTSLHSVWSQKTVLQSLLLRTPQSNIPFLCSWMSATTTSQPWECLHSCGYSEALGIQPTFMI